MDKAGSAKTSGWLRVSSFKPLLLGIVCVGIVACSVGLFLRNKPEALPLTLAGTFVAFGLLALRCQVVYQRGDAYRIATFFYSEVIDSDDVCMTVTNPGSLWTWTRIHLRRPARCGWMVSYVAVRTD